MGIINIDGIKLYAYHGCYEEESIIGGNYLVHIRIETDFEEASRQDDINMTVDYDEVCEIVKREMNIRSKLIESVAKRIADRLLEEINKIESVAVKVVKLNPPIKGEVKNVNVEYTTLRT